MKLALSLVVAVMLAGCAYGDKQTTIAPEVETAGSSIGQGNEIVLTVKDRRDDKVFGFRSDAYGNITVIKTEQDLEALFRDTLRDAFTAKGFSVVSPQQALSQNLLTVEIHQIENTSNANILTSAIRTKVTVKAIASNGRATYERSYWAEKEGRNVVTSTGKRTERSINEAVSVVLNDLANHDKLVKLFVADRME